MKMHYNLSDVLRIFQEGFKQKFGGFSFWFESEINKVNSIKGRVYLELVELDQDQNIKAKVKGIVFREELYMQFLKDIQRESLQQGNGLKILMHGKYNFHSEYGFSIIIDQISSEYTLGHLQQHQKNITEELKKLGIAEKNLAKKIGYAPFTIAVISSATSEGLKDFRTILETSGYHFTILLYEATIHGNQAIQAVQRALECINTEIDEKAIDLVAIMRGGGGSSGILRQNDLDIAKNICLMPIPVMVAVGHTSDTSVLDVICKFPMKTPSDAAHFLVNAVHSQALALNDLSERISSLSMQKIDSIRKTVSFLNETIVLLVEQQLENILHNVRNRYESIVGISPAKLTSFGYAVLTDDQGIYLTKKQISTLQTGDTLTVNVYDKHIKVKVV